MQCDNSGVLVTDLEAMRCRFVELEIPTGMPKGRILYSGVYLLVQRGEIVYVGASVEVEMRVWGHTIERRRGESASPKKFNRAFWCALPESVLGHYEGAFIRRLHPKYNASAPAHVSGYDNEILDGFGLPIHEDEDAAAEIWREESAKRWAASRARRNRANARNAATIAAGKARREASEQSEPSP